MKGNINMFYLKLVWRVIQKDLILEWRQKSFFISLLLVALLLLLISSMALEGVLYLKGAGFLWVILLSFSSIAGYQILHKESNNDAWRGLLLAPIDTSAIFYGKWLSQLILILLVEIIIVPIYILMFDFQISSVSLLVVTLVWGTAGFTVVSTFISSLTLGNAFGAILLPVLQLPILMPLFLAVISMTELAVYGMNDWPWAWFGLLSLYNLIFALIPWFLFPLLSEVKF